MVSYEKNRTYTFLVRQTEGFWGFYDAPPASPGYRTNRFPKTLPGCSGWVM